MDDQASHAMTPEEARVRLRQAAAKVDAMDPLRKYVWQISAAALGVGLVVGFFPSLRRGAVRSLGAIAKSHSASHR